MANGAIFRHASTHARKETPIKVNRRRRENVALVREERLARQRAQYRARAQERAASGLKESLVRVDVFPN